MAEETTRGRPQPRKAVTLARQRMIKKLADMLADPRCDKRTFLAVIRDFGLKMDRPSFFSSATCGTRGAASLKQGMLGSLYSLVLLLRRQGRKVPRNYLCETPGKLLGANSFDLSSHAQPAFL